MRIEPPASPSPSPSPSPSTPSLSPPLPSPPSRQVFAKIALAGAANMLAASATNPLDVVKIRLQLQAVAAVQSSIAASPPPLYRGFVHGLGRIWREEGARGCYKGLSASLLREGSYSALRFGLYDIAKEAYETRLHADRSNHTSHSSETSLLVKLLAGATSGAIGSALANPMDLVKVRLQGDRTGARYGNSLVAACRDIYRRDGLIRGFYRGVGPTTARAMVLTATQLPAYDHMKHALGGESFAVHVAASMFAGLMAATTSSPIDVLKTKIMHATRRGDGGPSTALVWHTTRQVWATDGLGGFFKGWVPNWLRIGPHTIISLLAYEELRAAAGIDPI